MSSGPSLSYQMTGPIACNCKVVPLGCSEFMVARPIRQDDEYFLPHFCVPHWSRTAIGRLSPNASDDAVAAVDSPSAWASQGSIVLSPAREGTKLRPRQDNPQARAREATSSSIDDFQELGCNSSGLGCEEDLKNRGKIN